MIAMVSLAASMGIPILSPQRGILPGIITAFVTVSGARLLASISCGDDKLESVIEDKVETLVEDGAMNLDRMRSARITRERLFAQLRGSGVRHLGQVRRFYFEANGKFSLVRSTPEVPGLSVLPDWDPEFCLRQKASAEVNACASCGLTSPLENQCGRCGSLERAPTMKT